MKGKPLDGFPEADGGQSGQVVSRTRSASVRIAASGLILVFLLAGWRSALASYEEGMRQFDRGNLREAVILLRKAAEAGNPRAQDQLGTMYEDGQGLTRDDVSAAYWYTKAARTGYPPAQLNLARMYRNGAGVNQDEAQAVYWYRKAAEQGLSLAQFFLGLMYDTGKGVPQDPLRAYMWYSLAAAQGDKDALYKRDRLAARLSDDQIRKAVGRGRRFGPMAPAPGGAGSTADTRPPPASYAAPDGRPPTTRTPRVDEAGRAARPLGREALRVVQKALQARGFAPGPADGLSGPRTRAAARVFRQKHGLAGGGALDTALLEALRAPRARAPRTQSPRLALRDGSSGVSSLTGAPLIRRIQRRLARLGFDPGPADGKAGRRTAAAVRKYQRARGLPIDGEATLGLLGALSERAAGGAGVRRGVPPGPASSGPVRHRERRTGLGSASGDVDEERLRPDPFRLSGRRLVIEYQRELNRLGFDAGPVDGVLGRKTVAAVKAFERSRGLTPAGRLTPSILRAVQGASGPGRRRPLQGATASGPESRTPTQADARPSDASGSLPPSAIRPGQGPAPRGRQLVYRIQVLLDQLGYPAGKPDGLIGRKTVHAARRFQRERGRQVTGVLGSGLIAALERAKARGWLSRDGVQRAQRLLGVLGYDAGSSDGIAGRRTRAAVEAFQRNVRLPVDGRLTLGLLERLERRTAQTRR